MNVDDTQAVAPRRRPLSRPDLLWTAVIAWIALAVWALQIGGMALAGLVAGAATIWFRASRTGMSAIVPCAQPTARARLVQLLDDGLRQRCADTGQSGISGAMMIEIDDFRRIEEHYDADGIETVLQTCLARVACTVGTAGTAMALDRSAIAVALAPDPQADIAATIQLAGRIQRALAEPIVIGVRNVLASASIGFSLSSRLTAASGAALLRTATSALIEAGRGGPGAIRSYSEAMRIRMVEREDMAGRVIDALDRGEISAYFQPQISTATNTITGFEALARWIDPVRGVVPPSEFLPALAQVGLMGRLSERMVQAALSALRNWDDLGLNVPSVSVNFSSDELRDPRIVDRLGWEIDRHDLTPDRLVIEVLETVVASRGEDVVIRNLAGLARLGCKLDLDDFGTGHASITSIRHLSIERIKIDRSFVTRIDDDDDQQAMVAAILTMADRLGLDTLAEGVETTAERNMLHALGCGHLQGFGIARPMPAADVAAWVTGWQRRHAAPRPIRLEA